MILYEGMRYSKEYVDKTNQQGHRFPADNAYVFCDIPEWIKILDTPRDRGVLIDSKEVCTVSLVFLFPYGSSRLSFFSPVAIPHLPYICI